MSPFRRSAGTLSRSLLLSAILVIAATAIAILGSVWLSNEQRQILERDNKTFTDEQRIADQIVELTYAQQFDAYRYLQRPDSAYLVQFRNRGEQAYDRMRQYLFHELSPEARLQVERMKEAHELFEVSAQRAFELVQRGNSEAAQARVSGLDERVRLLDTAVASFLVARAVQRDAFQELHRSEQKRAQGLLAAGVLLILAIVTVIAVRTRRRVLLPISDLVEASDQLSRGERGARVPPQAFEEFNRVAMAFNSMADRVQATRETIEAQNEELVQTLDNLRRAQGDLVQHEKLSAMGQMLAGLAHELNNPLAGVLGTAELLREELERSTHEPSRALAVELARPLELEALRARLLVQNLLVFARKPTGIVEPVPLAAAINTAVGLRAHAYVLAGCTLQVDVDPALRVYADLQKLQHAIVNLLNNALDAMRGGKGGAVNICVERESDTILRVDVEDDGPGFTNADEAIKPFYTTKAPGEGTGLGLSLVEQFVHEFGGQVVLTNAADGGARVSLRLRAAADLPRADADPGTNDPARLSPARGAPVVPDDAADERQTVLVVDDEPSLREVQRRLLERLDVRVILAASGREAIGFLESTRVDLVISDLRMPGEIDGRALFAWLNHHFPAMATRSLLVTGDVSGVASLALPIPLERTISKPFQGADYIARVRDALRDARVDTRRSAT